MEKYLIEVPHDVDKASCERAIKVFLATGSHFLTNAEWGCLDGEHKAWMIVEVENKAAAMRIVPAAYKDKAKIVHLNKFTRNEMEERALDYHT